MEEKLIKKIKDYDEPKIELVPEKKEPRNAKVVGCDFVNVRSTTLAGSEIIGVLKAGTEVKVNDDAINNFYSITTENGMNGFIIKDYLKFI